jgi:hypothetical protein
VSSSLLPLESEQATAPYCYTEPYIAAASHDFTDEHEADPFCDRQRDNHEQTTGVCNKNRIDSWRLSAITSSQPSQTSILTPDSVDTPPRLTIIHSGNNSPFDYLRALNMTSSQESRDLMME